MDWLTASRQLNPDLIDPNNYFISLLREAAGINLLSASQITNVQEQLMQLMKVLVIRYSGGSSTSIKVESAENLLLSLLYIFNIRFRSYTDPNIALAAMINTPLGEHYQIGLQLVSQQLEETWELYRQVVKTRLDTELIAYNDTIDQALPDFFSAYDFRYQAHHTPASIDYQLAWPVEDDLTGVTYIREYLQRMLIENRCCQLFSTREINRLLVNYGQVYRIDYPEYLLNLFEIIFTNALLAEVIGNDQNHLCFPREYAERLYRIFQRKSKTQVDELVYQAVGQLIDRSQIGDQTLINYIYRWIPQLLPRLYLALAEKTLERLFITDQKPIRAGRLIKLEMGSRLTDDEFRDLITAILECSSADGKMDLIMNQVHSWTDFRDLLDAECLFGDEYLKLYNLLGEIEVSMLLKTVGAAEFREGMADWQQCLTNFTEMEREWETQLIKYITALDPAKLTLIADLMNADFQITD